MNHPEHRTEVEQRRDQRGLGHFEEGYVDGLGHDEGHGAHDRRHDLAAHRRGRLDATSEGRAVTEALHQRDGELAGGDHVGHAGTGDGAHQCRGHDRYLGRAADLVAEQAHGEVGEQLDHPGLLEEGAKQNEQEDVGGRHIGRRAIQTFGAERQLVDDLIEPVATVHQITRQILAEKAINEEAGTDDRQGDAHDPARGFKYKHDQGQADDHVASGQVTGTLNQVRFEVPLVDGRGHTGQAQQPGQRLPRTPLAEGREADEHQQQQKADVYRTQHLSGYRMESGSNDLEDGEQQRNGKKRLRPVRRAGRQAVVLFTHAVHTS